MLISVTSSVLKQELGDYDFQTFNLIADFNPEVYKEKNVLQKRIEIYPEEYVIGSLFITDESDKNSIFEYYTMSIPYDADEIEID
jgi:alkyl hydroperoxide reductase subunit AhpC